jgi:hypothetical protein
MDKIRRQSKIGWAEREGEGFLQRSEPRKTRLEAAPTRRRLPARFFLREDDWAKEEADFSEDGK